MSFFAERCDNCGHVMQVRTEGQNAAQWPILNAWAEQKLWPVNGIPVREWKPYRPSRAMLEACAKAAAINKIPSLVR